MEKSKAFALLFLLAFFGGFCSTSALSPARVARGFLSNALHAILKRMWSLSPVTKSVISGRTGMKFESGYSVETVFDGIKAGIEPYSVDISPDGEILVLDSVNSNIYRISPPLSRNSRPKLLAGSAEGSSGHIDGRLRESRMNHPKSFTVDDSGNLYIADTMNKAIRKINDLGITTIAGGKWSIGGHVDGPSEDAQFSNDFEVTYVSSSCSLLVVDRGNQAIREIQLNYEDCSSQYISSIPLGISVILAAIFFGYMLGLLHRRGVTEPMLAKPSITQATYQYSVRAPTIPPLRAKHFQESIPTKPSTKQRTCKYQQQVRDSARPVLNPPEAHTQPKREERDTNQTKFINSTNQTNHYMQSGVMSTVTPIIGTILSGFRRKKSVPPHGDLQYNYKQQVYESYEGKHHKTYDITSDNPEKLYRVKGGRTNFNSWDSERQQQQQQRYQHQMQRHRQYSSGPQNCYERSNESTNEIVFGAVQEESDRKFGAMDIRPINYGDPFNQQHSLRSHRRY